MLDNFITLLLDMYLKRVNRGNVEIYTLQSREIHIILPSITQRKNNDVIITTIDDINGYIVPRK